MARRRTVEGSALGDSGEGPKTVPVGSIAHNPRNPRDHYNDVAELAMGIKSVGIMTPLAVTRYEMYLTHYPEHEHEIAGYDWVVLNGNRRLAAAKLLDLTEVPVTIADHLGRDRKFDEGVLIDNIHREKLPLLREALALQDLVDRHGSQSVVAERIGKTPAYVNQRLGLLRLVDELKTAVREKKLAFEDARKLSALPAEEQLPQWKRLLELREATGDADLARQQLADENRSSGDDAAGATADSPASAPRGRPRARTVKIGAPDEMATKLREFLSEEDLTVLVKLLQQPAP
ncbi:ParB/RepB/Spo0J family partition protein [Amycolatopsis japonica]